MWLKCLAPQSGGNTPPAREVPEVVLSSPPHATDDASGTPFVRAAAKCRTRCHGPSCEVAVILGHYLNSLTSQPWSLESCVRSTEHRPDVLSSATTANIACVHSDAGRIATVMLMRLLRAIC